MLRDGSVAQPKLMQSTAMASAPTLLISRIDDLYLRMELIRAG
jgi:hypothetical protein